MPGHRQAGHGARLPEGDRGHRAHPRGHNHQCPQTYHPWRGRSRYVAEGPQRPYPRVGRAPRRAAPRARTPDRHWHKRRTQGQQPRPDP
eukprot:14369506-Alexandrium_andersonii.AAC.1